jgi:uncharacterized membrane protein
MTPAMLNPKQIRIISLLAALVTGVCVASESPLYSIQELGNLPSGYAAYASSINDDGDVVGQAVSSSCISGCAVVWHSGVPTILQNYGNQYIGQAYSINDVGQIAGMVGTSDAREAVIWDHSSLSVLSSPLQYEDATGSALNNAGKVAGVAFNASGRPFAAVVWHGSTPTVLELPTGYSSAYALGINDAGLAVGNVCCEGGAQAATWRGSTPTLLAKIGVGPEFGGEALAVNRAGLIVGHVFHNLDFVHAAAWTGRTVTDLGTLANGTKSEALAVNARGVIAGDSDSLQAARIHAVLWSHVGAPTQDLNDLISTSDAAKVLLQKATGINDACTIVADGIDLVTQEPSVYVLTLIDASHCGAAL